MAAFSSPTGAESFPAGKREKSSRNRSAAGANAGTSITVRAIRITVRILADRPGCADQAPAASISLPLRTS